MSTLAVAERETQAPEGTLLPASERRLHARELLELDENGAIAVKRNQHEMVLAAPVEAVVAAFHEQLARPGASFGRIDVRRTASQVGKPFLVGERFTSVVSLERCFTGKLSFVGRGLAPLLRSRAFTGFAERFLGDFAEVSLLELDGPGPRRVKYRYLDGCPMAGESEYLVEALPDGNCRVRVTFTFQEQGALAISILHRFGLQVHDEAVRAQLMAVARELGADIVSTTL